MAALAFRYFIASEAACISDEPTRPGCMPGGRPAGCIPGGKPLADGSLGCSRGFTNGFAPGRPAEGSVDIMLRYFARSSAS